MTDKFCTRAHVQSGMMPGGLDAIYGVETEEAAQIGLTADALANLQSLERLEERVSVILLDDKAKVLVRFEAAAVLHASFVANARVRRRREVAISPRDHVKLQASRHDAPILCAQAPDSVVLDLTVAKDVGLVTVRNTTAETLNAEQVRCTAMRCRSNKDRTRQGAQATQKLETELRQEVEQGPALRRPKS
jgi:hypothetical protein